LTYTIRLTAAAYGDIVDILERSEREFGVDARRRHQHLVSVALKDVGDEPERSGSAARPELGSDVRSWHLRMSRERARTVDGGVRQPRHFILYTIVDEATVGVLRVLHDAIELHRHLGEGLPSVPGDDPRY